MRRMDTVFALVVGLFLGLGAAGCFGGGDGGGGGGGDGGSGDQCTADADCKDNTKRCDANKACVSKCASKLCGTGQTCEATTGQCINTVGSCTVDTDCNDATKRCNAGACVDKCQDVICNTGETCEPTTGVCAGGGGNTCSKDADCDPNNDNGRICDAGTCKGDLLGDCSNGVSCLAGLDCLTIPTQQGDSFTCYEPCTDSTTCALGWWCQKSANAPTVDHCDQNLCGPALAQYGYQGTAMMAPCDATVTGAGDGICMGPLVDFGDATTPLEIGLCYGTGTLAVGATCSADVLNGDPSKLCNAGLCATDTQGATTGICREFCTILDGTNCATGNTCMPLGGMAGICTPQAATPIVAGQTCTVSQTEAVCVEDTVCADPTGGTAAKCLSFCDTRANACATGTCTATSQSASDMLGLCL